MPKDIKILCVCRKGNVRSVGTKYALNRRGYNNVIATGAYLVTRKTFDMLCKWADVILLAKPNYEERVTTKEKINKGFTIGPDLWGTPVNLQLEEIADKALDNIGLI